MIKGAGESEIDFDFLIVSDRGECPLSGTKIHTIKLRAQTLIAVSQKLILKSIFSYSFWGRSF